MCISTQLYTNVVQFDQEMVLSGDAWVLSLLYAEINLTLIREL